MSLMRKAAGKTVRGEMTIFLSLTLLLIASVLFTLVEGARYRCLRSIADMDRVLEAESAFAEYQAELLKQYGLLFLDDSYGSGTENLNRIAGRIMDLSEYNLNPETGFASDLLRMQMKDCGVDAYEVATDYGGDAFRLQACEYAMENLGLTALEMFSQRVENAGKGKQVSDTTGYSASAKISAGRNAAREAREAEEKAAEEGTELTPNGIQPATDFENPLDLFDSLSGRLFLTMILPEGHTLSTKTADLSDIIERRKLYKGNYKTHKSTSIADTMLFFMFLDQSFGCYTGQKENKKLDYELEFLIAGHDSDKKNLETVTKRILLIREVTNFLYLQTDLKKVAIAESIAVAIGTLTMTLPAVEIIKQAILAAWAYVESIMELRNLLEGKKVALIKTEADWITDVLHPKSSMKQGTRDCSSLGLTYHDYLVQFLMLMRPELQNYRAMDMIELNLRMKEGNGFRMDCMIQKMDLSYRYEARPLFLSFVTIGDIDRGNYRFNQEHRISYLL